MAASSSKFITKVLGVDNFGKSRNEVPVYVEEIYPNTLNYAYNQGYIRGLNCEFNCIWTRVQELKIRNINSI
jgi:hypothetical protein